MFLFSYNRLYNNNNNLWSLEPQAFLRAAGSTSPQFHIVILQSVLSVISISTSVCLCRVLILSFFFLALFNVLHSHLHTQPSLLFHPPLQSPIHPSIHPTISPSIHPIWWYSQWNTWAIYKSIKAHSFQHSHSREKGGESGRGGGRSGELEEW